MRRLCIAIIAFSFGFLGFIFTFLALKTALGL